MSDESDSGEERKAAGIAEYLQAPRRKRKSYVIMAVRETFDFTLLSGIESFVRQQHKKLSISKPRSLSDLQRFFGRQIVLLVLEDEFSDRRDIMEALRKFKQRKREQVVPILFLTRSPKVLIEAYHKYLGVYQECDDYVDYSKVSVNEVINRVHNGLVNKNQRRSRRYQVKIPIRFFHLGLNQMIKGTILDISVHGALLRTEGDHAFTEGDQLKIYLPVSGLKSYADEEFLRLSAKVRRVAISGDLAGISYEYLQERQQMAITEYVLNIVNNRLTVRNQEIRLMRAREGSK